VEGDLVGRTPDENGTPHWWEPDAEHERKEKRLQFVFEIVVFFPPGSFTNGTFKMGR
jgi:hypothetical protein